MMLAETHMVLGDAYGDYLCLRQPLGLEEENLLELALAPPHT